MNYSRSIKSSLPSLILSRLMALTGISLVLALVAHKAPEDLGMFSYILALLSVISTVLPLLLATAGNQAASLLERPAELDKFFSGGFTLSLLVGALTTISCLFVAHSVLATSGVQHWDKRTFWLICLIYTLATPLIATNSFLQMFFEATGKAKWVASTKLKTTLACSTLITLSYYYSNTVNFTLLAATYFPLSEASTLFLLIRPIHQQQYISIQNAKKTCYPLLKNGLPIAAGMSGQKIYFYLLMDRLARIDNVLNSKLSVFMTVAGLILIPSLALTQLHSFQVSQHPGYAKTFYRNGLAWTLGLLLVTAILVTAIGKRAFYIAGGDTLHYDAQLLYTLIAFITSSSLLSLAVAHLRAKGETLAPQITINIIMLGLLAPLFYSLEPARTRVETFLMLQCGATALGFILLSLRISHIQRNYK